jgi:NitT/TauT family transport system substrate-binding protein
MPRIKSLRLLAVIATAALALTGCSVVSSLTGSSSATTVTPERSSLQVGIMPLVDVAPLSIANDQHLFDNAGLKVNLIRETSEADALSQLQNGTLDIIYANNVTLFKAASAGTQIQIQAEAYQAGTNTFGLVTKRLDDYTHFKIPYPRIAVDSLGGMSQLVSTTLMSNFGTIPSHIKFSAMSYSSMIDQLQNGQIDAAFMVEPYVTLAAEQDGTTLIDASSGAATNWPLSSYASTKTFANTNPKTVQVFRDVLRKAQALAIDPRLVQNQLPRYSDIDASTASLIAIGTYPTTLSSIRLQRVADLMQSAGLISERLDVQALLPANTATS